MATIFSTPYTNKDLTQVLTKEWRLFVSRKSVTAGIVIIEASLSLAAEEQGTL